MSHSGSKRVPKQMLPEIPDLQSPFCIPSTRPECPGLCAYSYCLSNSDLKQCSSCFNVAYCSDEHQLLDWKYHQEVCSPLVQLSEVGLYQTHRFIETDTVVLNLQPIMMSPHMITLPTATYQCIACCGIYKSRAGQLQCPQCSWSICSMECANNPIHVSNECQVFADALIKPDKAPLNFIIILRCLMLHKHKPDAFSRLLEIFRVFRGNDSTRSPKADNEDQVLTHFLMHKCGLETFFKKLDWSAVDIRQFLKVVELCTLTMTEGTTHEFVRDVQGSGIKRCVSAKYVFPEKYKIQRHCSPNMRWTINFDPNLSGTSITFRTTSDLKGHTILSAAWGDEIHCGTLVRQRMLTSRFISPCSCSRCVDPTENGTEFNTLRCLKCNQVSVRPINPTKRKSKWKCYTSSCQGKAQLPENVILRKIAALNSEFEAIQRLDTDSAIVELMKFFNGPSTKTEAMFHPRHFIMIRTDVFFARAVIQKLSERRTLRDIDFNLLRTVEKRVTDALAVYPKLIPGNTETLGLLLYQQQAYMSARCLRNIDWFMNQLVVPDNWSEITEAISEIIRIQRKGLLALQHSGVGTLANIQAIKLKRMITSLKNMFRFRCVLVDGLDENLLAQLYNMYAMVTNIQSVFVPNQPISYAPDGIN